MTFTENELRLFRGVLLARRAYRDTPVPLGAQPWEEWMQATLDKLTDELYIAEACDGGTCDQI